MMSPSAALSARCYVPRSVIVAVIVVLASCTDAATVMTRMKDTSMFRSKGDVDGNAAASAIKDNVAETYNLNAQNFTNTANTTDSQDGDRRPGAVGDEEALSAVWYLAAFGGLVLFFFVVTCSELFFGNPLYRRRTVELSHAGYLRRQVYGIRNHGQHYGGNYKPETPPPPYHLFAPPSYDDTVKGGFVQVLQQQQQQQQQPQQYHHRVPGKKLADVYVVPVHAATTAATGATTCAAGATTCATCTTTVAVAVADAKLLAAVLPQTKFK